jgi:methyl-accepting chemotaxis protein PixJ
MTQIFLDKTSHQDDNDRNSVDRQVETKENFSISAVDSEETKTKDALFEFEKKSLRFKTLRIRTRIASLPNQLASWWETVSLRNKAMIVAIAIGAIPVAGVGMVAYKVASYSLEEQIVTEQGNHAISVKHAFKDAIERLVDDVKILSHSPLLANCHQKSATSHRQEIALLNSFINARQGQYQSIAIFDLKGNLLCQSKSKHPFDPKHDYSKQEYFQRAIATKAPAISDPKVTLGKKNGLEVAAPITNTRTGKSIGVVVMRTPVNHFNNMFQYLETQGMEYRLIGSDGIVFAADEIDSLGKQAEADYEHFVQLRNRVLDSLDKPKKEQNSIATEQMWDRNDSQKVLLSFSLVQDLKGTRGDGWSFTISRPLDLALAPLAELRWIFWWGTIAATLVVAAIAAILAERGTRPILRAASAIEEIGRGKMDTRLRVKGKDELAILEANVNKMAIELGNYVEESTLESQRSQLLKNITLKLVATFDRQTILNTVVSELCQALKVDRVIIYRFEKANRGRIVAESVLGQFPRALGKELNDACFINNYINAYKQGETRAVPDIFHVNLRDSHLKELEAIDIKAYLAAPILIGGELLGLAIAQKCSEVGYWQQAEIDLLAQISSQLGIALDRANLLEQQRIAKEKLQHRALELLMEVEPINRGDLTVRAKITSDEIGTLADSYNSIVENLSKIIIQVQAAAQQVTTTTNSNQAIARSLSEDALHQSEAIATVLDRIQIINDSIAAVASNAQQAEESVREANQTVETSDAAMNRTVIGMTAITETVAETANKIECLGESSQEISKVVTLISNFAAQTKMLAFNASIEASRAGQEGKGFGIVAEEIRTLAQQSAEAVAEIERLVATIQRETQEVIKAMKVGTQQVIAGTESVDETRLSLNQIKTVSDRISNLVVAIAQATLSQSSDSKIVTEKMLEVGTIANKTATETTQVLNSSQELMKIASDLQTNTSQFKVNSDFSEGDR